MEIIKPEQLKKARNVTDQDIPRVLKEAEEITRMIEAKNFGGLHKEAVAIAANQVVADDPLNYFVLDKKITGMGSHIIVNPKIVSRELNTLCDSKEGCMTYPWKKEKRVDRYLAIRVEYQLIKRTLISGFSRTLVTERRKMGGMPAIVFQHEVQHLTDGKTIFD